MVVLQKNIFEPLCVVEGQVIQLVDIFEGRGKKTIELASHSSLTYLFIASHADIDIHIVTRGPKCSCKIFGLFSSDVNHQVTGSIKVSLDHSYTSADVDLISFLKHKAKVVMDGSIDVGLHLDSVHGRLLEQNIVLGKDISLKTLPELNVASHNVSASHGAKIDGLDPQKLFYMMSRGLTKEQSQDLLVDGYVEYVLGYFEEITKKEKQYIYTKII